VVGCYLGLSGRERKGGRVERLVCRVRWGDAGVYFGAPSRGLRSSADPKRHSSWARRLHTDVRLDGDAPLDSGGQSRS
jgi:hypothetical protein